MKAKANCDKKIHMIIEIIPVRARVVLGKMSHRCRMTLTAFFLDDVRGPYPSQKPHLHRMNHVHTMILTGRTGPPELEPQPIIGWIGRYFRRRGSRIVSCFMTRFSIFRLSSDKSVTKLERRWDSFSLDFDEESI